jgi:hypothetical protein
MILSPLCCHHLQAAAVGLKREAEEQWLMKMERQVAENIPDNSNRVLLLPSPL